MERIEIPATIYWKAKTGKKFTSQEDCEKYERLFDKWQAPERYREFENIEGQLCYAYWIETLEELDEITWLIHYKLDTSTCNYIKSIVDTFKPQWVVACPDYNECYVELAIRTLEDLREEVEDTLKAAQDTVAKIVKLIWEKA